MIFRFCVDSVDSVNSVNSKTQSKPHVFFNIEGVERWALRQQQHKNSTNTRECLLHHIHARSNVEPETKWTWSFLHGIVSLFSNESQQTIIILQKQAWHDSWLHPMTADERKLSLKKICKDECNLPELLQQCKLSAVYNDTLESCPASESWCSK